MVEAVCKRLAYLSTHKLIWERVNFRCFPQLMASPQDLSNFVKKRYEIKEITLCDLNKVILPESLEILGNKAEGVKTLKLCNLVKVRNLDNPLVGQRSFLQNALLKW